MTGSGILSDIIGWHGDLVILDDVIQEDAPRDLRVRLKKQDWFDETLLGCVDPNTKVWVIGTRKSNEDLYKHIMDKPGTVVSIKRAIIDEPQKKVLWPEKRPLKWLQMKRDQMGSFKFSREFQNQPVSAEGGILKREWLMEHHRLPYKRFDGITYMGVDPAIGVKKTADYTAIATIKRYDNKMYLVDLIRGRWNFLQTKHHIQQQYLAHKPVQIGLEANFFQRAISQDIMNSTMIPIVEVKHMRDKVERILSTVGYYAESGKLSINSSLNLKDPFYGEYLDFPEAEHDDLLDAVATCIEVAVNPVGAVLFV